MIIRALIRVGGRNEGAHELSTVDGIIVWRYTGANNLNMFQLNIEHREFLRLSNSRYNLPFKESDLDKLI